MSDIRERQTASSPRLVSRIRNARGKAIWVIRTIGRPVGGSSAVLGARSSISIRGTGSARFGQRVVIRQEFTASVEGVLDVGDDVFVGRGSLITCMGAVTIGRNVRLGERVSIHDENHVMEPLSDAEGRAHGYVVRPVTIGDRVWLGANVVVLPGATIGNDSVIAAGSVVRGAIPAGVLAAGNPATVKRDLEV